MQKEQVYSRYEQYGLNPKNIVHRAALLQFINQASQDDFDNQFFNQLCQESGQTSEGKISLERFSQSVLKAEEVLCRRIDEQNRKIFSLQKQSTQNQQLLRINSVNSQQRRLKTDSERIQQEISNSKSILVNFQIELRQLRKTFGSPVPQVDSSNLQKDLYFLQVGAVVCCCLYLILGMAKVEFVNLLWSLMLLAALLVEGLFYTRWLTYTLALLLLSFVTDILFLILYFNSWWNPPAQAELSSNMWGFYRLVLVMTMILLAFKLGVLVVSRRVREVAESRAVVLSWCGREWRVLMEKDGKY